MSTQFSNFFLSTTLYPVVQKCPIPRYVYSDGRCRPACGKVDRTDAECEIGLSFGFDSAVARGASESILESISEHGTLRLLGTDASNKFHRGKSRVFSNRTGSSSGQAASGYENKTESLNRTLHGASSCPEVINGSTGSTELTGLGS